MSKKIGDVIREARKRKGLTGGEMARLCNVARSSIYVWEGATFILPKNFRVLAAVLGLSEQYLRRVNGDDSRV